MLVLKSWSYGYTYKSGIETKDVFLYGLFEKTENEGALLIKMVPKLLYKRSLIGWFQISVQTNSYSE